MKNIINKISPKIIISLLFLAFSSILFAQSLKYDDIYEKLPSLSPSQGYFILLKFQKQDPYFGNTYIQMGHLSEKELNTIDPLRELENAKFWASNAILYYSLYPNFAKKGDANRNSEFYANIPIPSQGKRMDDENVFNYVNLKQEFYKEYQANTSKIYEALHHAKEHYNNSIQMFTEINNQYDNMNELLLHTDDEMLAFIDSLQNQFNEFKMAFDEYKKHLTAYPIGDYKQDYSLKQIETFRLDGLTNSDFLDNNFIVWNYNYWIKKFTMDYENDIVTLRNKIIAIQTIFNNNKIYLDQVDTVSSQQKFESYDNLFFYRLGRYDNYSIIKDLFIYHNFRQKFFIYGNSPISNPSDSSIVKLNTKLRYFYNLSLLHQGVLDELPKLRKNITEEKVARFKGFFNEYYNGYAGLIDFTESEKQVLYQTMQTDFKKLKSYYINQHAAKNSLGYIAYKKDSIALFINATDTLIKNKTYTTTHVEFLQGKPTFIAGIEAGKKQNKPFIAQLQNNEITWLKYISSDSISKKQVIKSLFAYSNGCVATLATTDDSKSTALVNVNAQGNKFLDKPIKDSLESLMVKYDEITQNYTLIFGNVAQTMDSSLIDSSLQSSIYSDFKIHFVDSMANTIWSTPINTKGVFIDINATANSCQAYINNLNQSNGTNHWQLSINPIDKQGNLSQEILVSSSNSFSIQQTFNVTNTNVNLIGFEGKNPQDWSGNLVYLVLNENGEISYSNLTQPKHASDY